MFLKKSDDFCLISNKTPLISNLNIVENIAIIKEVHEFMNAKEAHLMAYGWLDKVGFKDIADKRPSACTNTQKFVAMFLRAYAMQENYIFIINPLYLIDSVKDIKDIIEIMKLSDGKNVILLDSVENEFHYVECSCHTIK